MDWLSLGGVRKLRYAENRFLEVLLCAFTLERTDEGSRLRVCVSEDSPTIWLPQAKDGVRETIPDFRRAAERYQRLLDDFLIHRVGARYSFEDSDFPFRYASGGTLPILRIGRDDYYCFFYRDIFPVGWNIANGGCDTRHELRNPLFAVDRELREELISLDPCKEKRYVFEDDAGRRLDHPDFEVARRIWEANFPGKDVGGFSESTIPLRWLHGPDEVEVSFEGEMQDVLRGCFININASDYGIEVDRVARCMLDDDVILCDGEIVDGHLLNRVIGLFKTNRSDLLSGDPESECVPDRLFFSGHSREKGEWRNVIDEYIAHIDRDISKRRAQEWQEIEDKAKFGLCPVTRSILERHTQRERQRPRRSKTEAACCDVLISFSRKDVRFAKRVHKYLAERTEWRVFLSDQADRRLRPQDIDEAIESATCLVAVATDPRNLKCPWPMYESRAFHMLLRNERCSCGLKRPRQLIPCVRDSEPGNLPLPLVRYDAVRCSSTCENAGLKELVKRIDPHLRRAAPHQA